MNSRQRKVLMAIANFWEQWGLGPTIRQLSADCKLSEVAVYDEVCSLNRAGWIIFMPRTAACEGMNARLSQLGTEILPRIKEIDKDSGYPEPAKPYRDIQGRWSGQ